MEVTHRGIAAKVAQVAFNRPKVSQIHMDAFGSFIWKEINGEQSIYEIGQILEQTHEGASNQLYERLSAYFETLRRLHYIQFH